MKKTTHKRPPTKRRSTRTRAGTKARTATAQRKKAAAGKRSTQTAANPLPLGKWVKGAVKLVKKGSQTLVQFAR
jgi:hypothetical protein